MSVSIISACIGLLTALGVAFWLFQRQLERAAFAVVIAAPVFAGAAFAATGLVRLGATAPAPAAAAVLSATAPPKLRARTARRWRISAMP